MSDADLEALLEEEQFAGAEEVRRLLAEIQKDFAQKTGEKNGKIVAEAIRAGIPLSGAEKLLEAGAQPPQDRGDANSTGSGSGPSGAPL